MLLYQLYFLQNVFSFFSFYEFKKQNYWRDIFYIPPQLGDFWKLSFDQRGEDRDLFPFRLQKDFLKIAISIYFKAYSRNNAIAWLVKIALLEKKGPFSERSIKMFFFSDKWAETKWSGSINAT